MAVSDRLLESLAGFIIFCFGPLDPQADVRSFNRGDGRQDRLAQRIRLTVEIQEKDAIAASQQGVVAVGIEEGVFDLFRRFGRTRVESE